MNKALGIFVGIGLFFTAGCFDKSLTPEEAAAKKFATILTVVENGTTFAIKSYLATISDEDSTKVTGYINDAAAVIEEAVTSGKIKPDVFDQYVTEKLAEKVPAPYDTAIKSAIELALTGYNSFYAENVKDEINNNDKAKQVIQAIVSGLHAGTDPVSSDVGEDKNPLEGFDDWEL